MVSNDSDSENTMSLKYNMQKMEIACSLTFSYNIFSYVLAGLIYSPLKGSIRTGFYFSTEQIPMQSHSYIVQYLHNKVYLKIIPEFK